MNQIILLAIILLASVPVCYAILRIIFKKSIMFKVVFPFVMLTLFEHGLILMTRIYSATSIKLAVITIEMILGTLVCLYINRIMRQPLDTLISRVKRLATGDLGEKLVAGNRTDEIGQLNNSILELQGNLRGIVQEIRQNSDSMISTSVQISNTSQRLAEGANTQAASTEEISATMEEMQANISQNAENAKYTEKISGESQDGVAEVQTHTGESTRANNLIAERITVINDLAYQTNILALNAAVEAARAGEYGRGFAVVAAEVRKLAERSKEAAEDIIELADNSQTLSSKAGESLASIVPQIEKTADLVKEIAAASREQHSGSEQVNRAIQDLSQIAQENATTSENLAGTSEQMTLHAERLKDMVSYFQL